MAAPGLPVTRVRAAVVVLPLLAQMVLVPRVAQVAQERHRLLQDPALPVLAAAGVVEQQAVLVVQAVVEREPSTRREQRAQQIRAAVGVVPAMEALPP